MESILRLRSTLLTALGSRGVQHGDQELFGVDKLMVHQQRLLKLFDVGPRSSQEQREIKSGTYNILGGVVYSSFFAFLLKNIARRRSFLLYDVSLNHVDATAAHAARLNSHCTLLQSSFTARSR